MRHIFTITLTPSPPSPPSPSLPALSQVPGIIELNSSLFVEVSTNTSVLLATASLEESITSKASPHAATPTPHPPTHPPISRFVFSAFQAGFYARVKPCMTSKGRQQQQQAERAKIVRRGVSVWVCVGCVWVCGYVGFNCLTTDMCAVCVGLWVSIVNCLVGGIHSMYSHK